MRFAIAALALFPWLAWSQEDPLPTPLPETVPSETTPADTATAEQSPTGAERLDTVEGKLTTLEQQVRHKAPQLDYESRDLLALTAYVARQSRGMPIAVDEKNKSHIDAGRAFFQRRQGQLNLACAQCHDDNWGKKLAGTPIPQAHPTGYPLYRLEWQSVGSLQRRLRNCMIGMRAEPYPFGAAEHVDMELYLMWRARGMKLETPAVRP